MTFGIAGGRELGAGTRRDGFGRSAGCPAAAMATVNFVNFGATSRLAATAGPCA